MSEMNDNMHPLHDIFKDVLLQVMHGKGVRHGGAATPFLEQPWVKLADAHGIGFLSGQAAKKLEEAMTRVCAEHTVRGCDCDEYVAAQDRELLGAIAYLGMTVIYHRRQHKWKQVHK